MLNDHFSGTLVNEKVDKALLKDHELTESENQFVSIRPIFVESIST